MAGRDIVVIGGSAGSVVALRTLVSTLPKRIPASIFVVTHLAPTTESQLAEVLGRAGPLPTVEVRADTPIERGVIYVATANHHLVLKPGTVCAVMGPRENRHRPSVDVLFRSAAETFGPRVAGVVLSGALDDGAAGLGIVKAAGGITVVQDPEDAQQPSMPRHALQGTAVDHCLPADRIGPLLGRLASGEDVAMTVPPEPRRVPPATSAYEGPPAAFACPECNGTLWEVREGDLARYRCRVGHAYSEESLVAENGLNLERALWTALRILEERAAMLRQLADAARARGLDAIAQVHEKRINSTERDAAVLSDVVHGDLKRHTSN